MAPTRSTTAAATSHSGRIVIGGVAPGVARGCEDGQEATHFRAMTFCTHDVVSVLMANEQFKSRCAISTVVLV